MPRNAWLLLLLFPFTAAATEAGIGQLTLVGVQASGDYGGETDLDTQSALLRFEIGEKTRFSADVDLRRVRTDLEFATTPLGPVPTRRRGPGGSSEPGAGPGPGPGANNGITGSTPTNSNSDAIEQPLESWHSGIGDTRLRLSHQIVGGGASRFRLDAETGIKLPTGDDSKNLGTGELDYRLGLAGSYRYWSLTGFAGVGWNRLGDPEWAELENVLDLYAGVQSEPLRDTLVLSGWLEGNQEVVAGSGFRSALGLGLQTTGKLRWRAQFTAGLSGSAEDFSALAGVSFGGAAPTIGSQRMH